jgi:hypothetical protein
VLAWLSGSVVFQAVLLFTLFVIALIILHLIQLVLS